MSKINYQNGKIYKIQSHVGDKIYIGSTTKQYLSQRMERHRNKYKGWKKGKERLTNSFLLFDEYGLENCEIVLFELFPCNSKDELNSREAFHIKSTSCVNKIIPCRTIKEWRVDNKDRIKEESKEYYRDNKEKIKDHQTEYRKLNIEKIRAHDRERARIKREKIKLEKEIQKNNI